MKSTPRAKRVKTGATPTITKATPVPKKPTPSKMKATPVMDNNANGAIVMKAGGDSLNNKQVSTAVSSLLKHLESVKPKSELFDSDSGKIQLQIAGIKLPKDERKHLVKMVLPNNCLTDPFEVCLIVKDLEKGIRPDHEPTVAHFNELLAKKGVKEMVNCVMPLRELKVEYKAYEAKTQLCHKYDKFLVDERIVRLVPKFLGKPFYKRKRFPVPVNLEAKDLKEEMERAIKTSVLPLSHHGNSSLVNVANAEMSQKEIEANVMATGEYLSKRYPGGWKNIRSIHIKAESSIAIPLHLSTMSANDVGFVDASKPKVVRETGEKCELSTQPGMEITVLRDGKVKINKTQDPEWDDEKDEPFNEGSDSESEEEEEEKTLEQKKKASAKKRKAAGIVDKSKLKKKNNKRAKVDSDEEEDAEMEDAELKYMQKVAEEEEEIEKKTKAAKKAAGEDVEESAAEEEEDDDDEEGSGEEEEDSDVEADDVVVDSEEEDSGNSDSDAELMVQ